MPHTTRILAEQLKKGMLYKDTPHSRVWRVLDVQPAKGYKTALSIKLQPWGHLGRSCYTLKEPNAEVIILLVKE